MSFNLPSFRREIAKRNGQEINNIFEDFISDIYRGSSSLFTRNLDRGFYPSIDILETEANYCVEAELAGINQNNIDVKLEDNILTIKGKKVLENENKEKNYYTRERVYGEFQRSISLPTNIDEDKIEASFKEGVLSVKIPKKNDKNIKKVNINVTP
jgi:HSP20 family protein